MDIVQRFSEEHIKTLTIAVVDYIVEDKTKFKILMDLFLNGQTNLFKEQPGLKVILQLRIPN